MTSELQKNADVAFDRARFEQLAAGHYENFPVGSWLAPERLRPHIHRIYAFARTADDLADEGGGDPEGLAAYRAAFLAHESDALEPARRVPLFEDLWATMRVLSLPKDLFLALLDAFEQDLTVRRYRDDEELYDYCRRSADPVGRLVLRVFGYDDPGLDALSDRICTGLQLLNHLQDLRADLEQRDRIYFPAAQRERFGVTEDELRAGPTTPGMRRFVEAEARRVATLFDDGWPLIGAVRGRLRLELKAIVHGACAVLRRFEATGFDPFNQRVHLSKAEKVGALLRAFLPGSPAVLRRLAAPRVERSLGGSRRETAVAAG